MATYAIGDVQGCYDELRRLLDAISFDPAADRLWFTGDLVNRGPASLACLRLVRALGDCVTLALGNHDLHLLVLAEGFVSAHRGDTLDDVLAAPDRDELLLWLRSQALLHAEGEYLLVHAGLLPGWTAAQARTLATEVESALCGADFRAFCAAMYGNQPDQWHEGLTGYDRLRVITNACTRLRFCTADGRMEFAAKGDTAHAPPGFLPWFDVPGRASAQQTVVCGHWAALGLCIRANLLAIDSGCVWGGALTAVRLDDRRVFQVNSATRAAD